MSRQPPAAKSNSGPDEALRLVIADRSSHFRDTLRRVLRHHDGCAVVGEAGTLLEAVGLAAEVDPHIVLLDIDLVINEHSNRLRRIVEKFPFLRVIVMLNEESTDYRLAVAERWGYGCIVKDQAERELDSIIAGLSRAVA